MIRRGYTTRMRFFADSLRETVVRWYFCRPDARILPFATIFNSAVHRRGLGLEVHLGEIQGASIAYVDGNMPPRGLGRCYVGTPEQYRDGITLADLANTKPHPECCMGRVASLAERCRMSAVVGLAFRGTLQCRESLHADRLRTAFAEGSRLSAACLPAPHYVTVLRETNRLTQLSPRTRDLLTDIRERTAMSAATDVISVASYAVQLRERSIIVSRVGLVFVAGSDGGLVISGAAPAMLGTLGASGGTLSLNGVALCSVGVRTASDGSMFISGVAPALAGLLGAARGTLTLSGLSGDGGFQSGMVWDADGGFQLSGTGGYQSGISRTGTGGIQLSGTGSYTSGGGGGTTHNGNDTAGSTSVFMVPGVAPGTFVGQTISGPGIPAGTTVVSNTTGGTLIISQPATSSNFNVTFTFV